MVHLWYPRGAGDWTASPIDAPMVALDAGLDVLEPGVASDASAEGVVLHRLLDAGETWVLLSLASGDLRLNGEPMRLGIAILSDRDELSIAGQPSCFFSTETLARIEPLPALAAGGCCPRCKLPIDAGVAAVRCPGCGLWHHSTDDMPCWTYAPTCAGCTQDTSPDAGFRWTPEDL